jgi:hypothetical protein
MGDTLKINVAEQIKTAERTPGTPVKEEKVKTEFSKFLAENGYVNDGSFILTVNKDKSSATLWKKVATFDGIITT